MWLRFASNLVRLTSIAVAAENVAFAFSAASKQGLLVATCCCKPWENGEEEEEDERTRGLHFVCFVLQVFKLLD